MKLRFEKKYLVPNGLLAQLRNRFIPFVTPDAFAVKNTVKAEYTVRSVYFDSFGYEAMMEKKEGLENRKKLRIRGYDSYYQGCEVFLEIKKKVGNKILKHRAITDFDRINNTIEDCEIYSSRNAYSQQMKEDAQRFFFNLKTMNQHPVNLIVYDREAFQGKFNRSVRVTFDKNIRAAVNPGITDLFSNQNLELIWKEHFILEVKYFEEFMPSWARSIVKEFDLQSQALSKYASAFMSTGISSYNIKLQ
jgi:hypothetical protein